MPEGTPAARTASRPVSRRRFFALGLAARGAGAAAFLAGCSARSTVRTASAAGEVALMPALPTPEPTPEPPPLRPRGREAFSLMTGTDWETPATVFHSGLRGTRVMVLGGVHGNEPGGWLAAEQVAQWEVAQGSLLVVPKVNRRSDAALERTLPGFGDLNRLYPGDPNGVPMSRMAAEIVRYATAFQPDFLIDMHESWVFYNERGSSNGTAFIGQTVAVGVRGPAIDQIAHTIEVVNSLITYRERLVLRTTNSASGLPTAPLGSDGRPLPVQTPPPAPGVPASIPNPGAVAGGTTSLAIGNWVRGCAPILIELGQMDQPEGRRAEIHQIFARTLMTQMGMM